MAITLANYYEQYANGDNTGLYSQPGGPTIPNPNNPNNNSTAQYSGVTFGGFNNNGTNPAPLITVPVTQGAIGNSGEGLLSSLSGGGLSSIPGVGGLGGGLLNIVDGATGGIVEELAAGALDAARITKFLATPQGIAFNLKQVWLQAMNTKVPHEGLNNDTRIYNLGINTLLQVPLEAIDIHIERHGLFPSFQEYPYNKGVYSQYFNNPLRGTRTEAGEGERTFDNSLYNLKVSRFDSEEVDIGGDWFHYGGGPKSKFGIGRTIHRRWTASDNDPSGSTGVQSTPLPDLNPTSTNLPTINIISATALSSGLPRTLKSLDTENLDLFKNASIGRVGSRIKDERKNLKQPSVDAIDKINYVGLLKGPSSDKLGKIVEPLVDEFGFKTNPFNLPKDLIKFRFESIDNNNPSESIFTIFRAFLSGINDRYSPNWNSQQYVGRGEKFYIYDGFARDISFNFTIAAQTRDEVKPLIQKLNFLSSNTMPDYNSAGRMRGPFMKLTIGDYFVSLPGFISSLTYTIKDDSPWDIALYKDLNDDFGKNERELPHMIDVSVSYTPIHDFLPKKGTNDVFYMLGVGDKWITELPPMDNFEEPIDDEEGFELDNIDTSNLA
jgi:hypothetical protein